MKRVATIAQILTNLIVCSPNSKFPVLTGSKNDLCHKKLFNLPNQTIHKSTNYLVYKTSQFHFSSKKQKPKKPIKKWQNKQKNIESLQRHNNTKTNQTDDVFQANMNKRYNLAFRPQFESQIKEFNESVRDYIQKMENLNQNQTLGANAPKMYLDFNFFSGIYRFLHLEANKYKFSQGNKQGELFSTERFPLSAQNRRKIIGLIRAKMPQQTLGKTDFSGWNLQKHLQICETVYLSIMFAEKRHFPLIINQFLAYLKYFKCDYDSNKSNNNSYNFVFSFQRKDQTVRQDKVGEDNLGGTLLPINISQICYSSILQDSLPYQIITTLLQAYSAVYDPKNGTPNRNKIQLFEGIRAFSKLLAPYQLRKLDRLLCQLLLSHQYQMHVLYEKTQLSNSQYQLETPTFTVEDIGKLASVLSQLNLNGSALQYCQQIFHHYLQRQFQLYQQIIQSPSSQRFPESHCSFELIMKMFIAFSDVRALGKQCCRSLQALLTKKIVLTTNLLEAEKKQKADTVFSETQKKNFRLLRKTYGVNQKQTATLVSVFHKYKRGQCLFQNNQHGQVQNFWLALTQLYQKGFQNRIPEQFLFSFLSAFHRLRIEIFLRACRSSDDSERPFTLQILKKLIEKIQLFTDNQLILQIYGTDSELSYLEEIQLDRLLEYTIVVSNTIYRGIQQLFKKKIQQGQLKSLESRSLKFYEVYLEKLQRKLTQNKNKHLQSLKNTIDQNQMEEAIPKDYKTDHNSKISDEKNLKVYEMLIFFTEWAELQRQILHITENHKQKVLVKLNSLKKTVKDLIKQPRKNKNTGIEQNFLILLDLLLRQTFPSNLDFQPSSNIDSQAKQTLSQVLYDLLAFIGYQNQKDRLNYFYNIIKGVSGDYLTSDKIEFKEQFNKNCQELNIWEQACQLPLEIRSQVGCLIQEQMMRTLIINSQQEYNQFL